MDDFLQFLLRYRQEQGQPGAVASLLCNAPPPARESLFSLRAYLAAVSPYNLDYCFYALWVTYQLHITKDRLCSEGQTLVNRLRAVTTLEADRLPGEVAAVIVLAYPDLHRGHRAQAVRLLVAYLQKLHEYGLDESDLLEKGEAFFIRCTPIP